MKYVLTDMGGVLIDLHWEEYAAKIFNKKMNIDELHLFWTTANSPSAYDKGKITFSELTESLKNEYSIKLSKEQIAEYFLKIAGKPKKNLNSVIDKIKKQFTIAILSNTNDAHISHLKKNYSFLEKFDKLFLSYELGLLKPNPEIFLHAVKFYNALPEDFIYFDDIISNVEAAKSIGMHAYQVFSPDEILNIINKLTARKDNF